MVGWKKDAFRETFTIKKTKETEKYIGLHIRRFDEFIRLGHESKIDEAIQAWELTQVKSMDYPSTDNTQPFQNLV